MQFLRPLPKIALIPLVVVWFGIGEGSKFVLIFLSTGLSVVVSAAARRGLGQRDAHAGGAVAGREPAPAVHLRRAAAQPCPELLTGIRLSVGIGWTSLIAAEMVAATSGLGWMVLNASSYLRTDVVMLGILLLGLTGYAFDWVLLALQRRWVPWAGRD